MATTTATTGTDLFSTFVSSLASQLDDHEATGDDLAARMYLSRSHFDRVVGAASGETPGRFRRRVLLERAAFRLLTSDAGVLDIAVEAGYSSHEAFTRAFARSYGAAPSVWRDTPTKVQLETPNGVHFHPPGGLRLPARTKVTSMDLLTRMVEHHVWLVGELVDRAATLRDDVLDAPIVVSVEGVDDDPTLRSLLSRLIGQMHMWNEVIAHRDYDWGLEDHEAIDDMRARHEQQGEIFLGQVRDVVRDGRLDETFVDAHCTPPEVYTYGGLIAHVLTFAAYRRTLAVGALTSAGVDDLGTATPASGSPKPLDSDRVTAPACPPDNHAGSCEPEESMFETEAELRDLQGLLDTSLASATDHLRGIINDDRTLPALEVVGLLTGMRTLSLATVTAQGEPRVSALDGHLLHAQWIFSTSVTSAKARHIHRRPAVSASYLEGEELGIFTHGRATRITETEADYGATLAYVTGHYGSSPLSWGDTALYRLVPSWMVGYAARREDLLTSRGVGREPRDEAVT